LSLKKQIKDPLSKERKFEANNSLFCNKRPLKISIQDLHHVLRSQLLLDEGGDAKRGDAEKSAEFVIVSKLKVFE